MRSLFILAFVLMQFGVMAADVPPAVEKNFKSKYPTATDVEWSDDEDGTYAAYFTINDQSKTAKFQANGSWAETKTYMDETELPEAIVAAVKSKYAEGEIIGVTMIELPNAANQYEINTSVNETSYVLTYDEKGQLLKTLEEVMEDLDMGIDTPVDSDVSEDGEDEDE